MVNLTFKNIKECPSHINHRDGSIGNPNLIYPRILIGNSVNDEYTFYADEEWEERARKATEKVIRMLDKIRVQEGGKATGELTIIPMELRYMANLIVIDGVVEKDISH